MGRSSKRFSYLLLEEGECYIQDWMATCRPGLVASSQKKQAHPWQQRKLKGRLRLCSKSIFFEPDNIKTPIVMFPLNKVKKIEGLSEPLMSPSPLTSKWSRKQEAFVMETSLHVKMKEGGFDAPYISEKQESIWWVSLDFAPVQQFLLQAHSLLSINLLPLVERDMVLRNTMAQREAKARFDTSRLVDLAEEIFLDCPAAQVTPLVREPGRLVITQAHLYFQPMHNLNNDNPVRSQPLNAVVAVARRRHAFQQIGLEIFSKELDAMPRLTPGSGLADGASVFFTFQNVEERERAAAELLKHLGGQTGLSGAVGSLLEADSFWLDCVMHAWQERLISNYDYLIYLNLAAGRSFCDLTQWPVMPWVLADYTSQTLDLEDPRSFRDLSKPIGALNTERLAVFQDRYSQMFGGGGSDPPFLYGTHYSTPGYVLYWLVRAAPAHMLRLQNGRFDAPDRLFISIRESWESVLNNPADLKELIPEFFTPPSNFLLMREGLNLGVRQNDEPVGDVMLPPWAKSPNDFIMKHRQALESESVSMNLHLWIDLIFGFKQRGEAALTAYNAFHPLTYEGAIDLDKIDNPMERISLEAQINEFGQTPCQLFTEAHPMRLPGRGMKSSKTVDGSQCISKGVGFRRMNPQFLEQIIMIASHQFEHTELIECIDARHPNSALTVKDFQNDYVNDLSQSVSTPKCAQILQPGEHGQQSEGSILNYSMQVPEDIPKYIRVESSKYDSSFSENWSPASTSGSDVKENTWLMSREEGDMGTDSELSMLLERRLAGEGASLTYQNLKNHFLGQSCSTTSVSVRESENGLESNYPWHWMFRQRLSEPQSLRMHRGQVHALVLSEDNSSGSLTLYSVGQDGFIKVYSMSEGFQIRSTNLGNLPLCSIALARSCDAYPIVLAGSYDDHVYAYSVDYGRALGRIRAHDETVSCVRVMEDSIQRLITASWDATVKVWSLEEGRGGWSTMLTALSTIDATVGTPDSEFLEHDGAVLSLDVEQSGHLVVSGAEDGSILAWDMRNPTSVLWQQCDVAKGPVVDMHIASDGTKLVVAYGNGCLQVLEIRQGGTVLATNDCEASLRCCEIAGQVIIAGSSDGALHFWHFNSLSGISVEETISVEEAKYAAPFLDYSPIHDHSEAVNSISIATSRNGRVANLATASDDGSVQVYSIGC